MSLLSDLRQDLKAAQFAAKGGATLIFQIIWIALLNPGFRAVCLYRLEHAARRRRLRRVEKILTRLMYRWCHGKILADSEIAPGFVILHAVEVVIGGTIGANCVVRHGVTLGGNHNRKAADGRTLPLLEDNVSVGPGAKILGPITIGSGSFIGANAVVTTDIPPNSIVAGIPARVIRRDGKKVPLLERGGELAELLGEAMQRLSRLEFRLDQQGDSPQETGEQV